MTKSASTDPVDHNLPVLTVAEVSQALKRTVEGAFARVRVRGEISGFKRAASGHLYFSLKDTDAVLDGVCWRGSAGRLGLAPEDGMEVIAAGRLTTYPGRSKYQIVVESMELAGEGALLKLLEERRKKLAAEGLFDAGRKRDVPFLPDVIGVVTSPTGAVIRDILHRVADRFPRRVILWPVLVQGKGAAEQVAAAIDGFNRLAEGGSLPRPDVLIVARGGGSLEDLMAFNEENVVRAAAASQIPLISAIGHETDTTLIDHAADRRAPTPTAAAEMAVPVRMELASQVMDTAARMVAAANRMTAERRTRIEGLARGLPNLRRMLDDVTQRLDDWSERLGNSLRMGIARRRSGLSELAAALPHPGHRMVLNRNQLAAGTRALHTAAHGYLRQRQDRFRHAVALLESYSYKGVLKRGFALIRDRQENPITSGAMTRPGMGLTIKFHDGTTGVTVNENGKPKTYGKTKTGPAKPKGKKSSAKDARQGKLL